ncbi:GntR family transcriptional regulator [Virgibacillus phasianinus]|uniref:GntR family transcriptional regulator n=1 Tax=Virgibacillus phasianinus TaxID=2017483 RepID=A0A220U3E7_9BACI|nr:GntR family transcriptional regulator [Virgibacillus phasianinus]ASK62620.1 GntR family transcriptional regulator [Virgibacillus phasianinus]
MIKENKQQKAYRVIKERIIERVFVPGQRIVIDQLAKELKSSSIPVREAIRQLESERLVFYKQNVGPVVAQVNETAYSDALRVLAVLEGYATAMTGVDFPKEKITMLKEKNKEMEVALEDFDILLYGKLNFQFHQIICEECKNPYLVEQIKDTWARLDSIRGLGSTLYSKRVKTSIIEHNELIDLLENSSDFPVLESAARMHKIRTAEDFERRRLKQLEISDT